MAAARQRVVTNTMLRPNGLPVYPKTVSIQLNNPGSGWESNHVNEITTKARAETDRTGKWSVTLDVNADIEDGLSYYTVREASDEVWAFVVIPGDFSVPLNLRDILVDAPGGSDSVQVIGLPGITITNSPTALGQVLVITSLSPLQAQWKDGGSVGPGEIVIIDNGDGTYTGTGPGFSDLAGVISSDSTLLADSGGLISYAA